MTDAVKDKNQEQEREQNQEQKRALITGASSGIGQAIARRLASLGYQVTGIGRHFKNEEEDKAAGVRPVELDLTNELALQEFLRAYHKEGPLDLLVHSAGVAYYGMAEEISAKQIREMTRVDLEVPMLLTSALLRDLKKTKGTILFISSVTANAVSPRACVYGAAKAGLSAFAKSLFEENRKYGVKVCTIAPDLTDTKLYRSADFRPEEGAEFSLSPQDTADAVEFVVTRRAGEVLTELTLRPQKNRIRKVGPGHATM